MRKIFEYIGLLSLMCFSFFITEKTSTIAKNTDEIMITIKEEHHNYETEAINAIVNNDTIIPGVCAKKVDVDNSYNKMINIGMYDDTYYTYTYEHPSISLINNYDKYVTSGNKMFNNSYIFISLDESIKDLLNEYEFKNYNFIVTSTFYKDNSKLINMLLKDNSILISNSNYKDYKQINKSYLSKMHNNIACYNGLMDEEYINNCSSNKSISIKPIETINDNYLLNIKKNLSNGVFLKLELNKELINSIKIIEDYIKEKGVINIRIDNGLYEC